MKKFSEWLLLRETLMGKCRKCGAENVELWRGGFCEKCHTPYEAPEPNSRPLDSMVNTKDPNQNRYRTLGQKSKLYRTQ